MSAHLLETLTRALGPEGVLREADAMAPALTDWMGRYRGHALCVARPRTTEQVAAVVRACAEASVAIVPQGGNTGLAGAATPDESGQAVVLSLARLRAVREVDPVNFTMTAEAGCVLAELHEAAAGHDRLFPLHYAAEGTAQLGGALSTNAGGMNVLHYGTARALVLGLEVVLPDGRVWDGLRRLRKDNTGYDLKQLFVGAEGTLGVITAAVVKLWPIPRHRLSGLFAVPDVAAALALLQELREATGDGVTCFEFLERAAVEAAIRLGGASEPMAEPQPVYAAFEIVGGGEPAELQAAVEAAYSRLAEDGRVLDAVLPSNAAQARAIWDLRETVADVQGRLPRLIKHDVAVPVASVPAFLTDAGAAVERRLPGVRVMAFGHLGDGNVHYNLTAPDDLPDHEFAEHAAEVTRAVHDVAHAHGGTISAEHGIGREKRTELRRFKSDVELDLMRRVKAALDPDGLMNPAKVL